MPDRSPRAGRIRGTATRAIASRRRCGRSRRRIRSARLPACRQPRRRRRHHRRDLRAARRAFYGERRHPVGRGAARSRAVRRSASWLTGSSRLRLAGGMTPIPDSYWVSDTLIAGEYPGAKDAASARLRVRRMRRGRRRDVRRPHPGRRAAGERFGQAVRAARERCRGRSWPRSSLPPHGDSGRRCPVDRRDERDPRPDRSRGRERKSRLRALLWRCRSHSDRGRRPPGAGRRRRRRALEQVQKLRAGTPKANRRSPENARSERTMVREWRG